MGRSVNRSRTTKANLEAHAKRLRALELRRAGATFDQIAEQVGYASRGKAHDAVMAALADVIREPAEKTLALELDRLDALTVALWPKVRRGDEKAVQAVLRVMERRAKLLGLDDFESRLAAVAEQQQAAAERWGSEIAALLQTVLVELGLSEQQWARVPVVVSRHLTTVAAPALPAGDDDGERP